MTSDFVNIARMNAITGAIVCDLTAALGIFMILIAAKKTKRRTGHEGHNIELSRDSH